MSTKTIGFVAGLIVLIAGALCPPPATAQVVSRLENAVAVFDESDPDERRSPSRPIC